MLTIDEIEARIQATGRRIEELLGDVQRAAEEAAVAEAEFKTAFAQVRLRSRAEAGGKVTVDHVDDLATVATEDKRLRWLIAQNALTVCREALRARESQLDALRSLMATYRGAGG